VQRRRRVDGVVVNIPEKETSDELAALRTKATSGEEGGDNS